MSIGRESGFPHCPPGLEHVDTLANLKALSKLSFDRNRPAPHITSTIIPPDGCFDDERVKLQHIDAPLVRPNFKVPGTTNNGACGEPVFVTDKHKSIYFLPHGLLDDDETEEMVLLQHLDSKASIALRRQCDATRCLRARAYKITAHLSQDSGQNFQPRDLFVPISSSSTSWLSSSSDCSSEDSSVFPPSIFRSHTPCSTTSAVSSVIRGRRHSDGPESGIIYFHRSTSEGVLLSDIKSLKSGSILGPDEDVMASWGMPGSPKRMRIMINQHGYTKKSVYLPIRCHCANITRAALALDIASLLERYLASASVRPGFEECSERRHDIEDLYLHSLRRNMDDPFMVWRMSISPSAVSWAKYSSSR